MTKIYIQRFKREARSIQVIWHFPDSDPVETRFYRHIDGSWHPDPETKKRGNPFIHDLNDAIMLWNKKRNTKHYVPVRVWFGDQ